MKRAYNTSHIRKINQRTILDKILRDKKTSKAELARQLGLSKPAVSDNVQALLDIGLVKEIGQGESSEGGGRRPTILTLNEKFRYIITVDFFYTFSNFMIGDLRGQVVQSFSVNQTPAQSFSDWVDMCINAINMLLLSQGIDFSQLAAIGFSAPGVINSDEKRVIVSSAMSKELNLYEFTERMKDIFGCPIYCKNSANVYAVSEAEYGAAKGYKNVLYITSGEGFGAGILINGRLYEGGQMAAGEIGNFVTYESRNEKSRFEERICVEQFINKIRETAPQKTISKLDLNLDNRKLFLQIVSLWKNNDEFIRNIVEEIATQIGCAVANMSMLLNCDVVIMGGEYLVFNEQIVPIVQKIINERSYLPSVVLPTQIGTEGRGLGMLLLCREFYFDTVCGISE